MVKPAREFVGTDRFSLLRRLGTGGMGVVYEAHDRKTDRLVALKTLTRAEAAHIYRFKREFRTLADVSHPNLVTLYELMSAGNDWFFTMELVQGVTFINYVRPDTLATPATDVDNTLPARRGYEPKSADSEADTEIFDSSRITLDEDDHGFNEDESLAANLPLDENRLRFALRQLAEGVNRLHELGKLHRDIKPSNVLVTEEGRVVILDFGLVEDINPELRETLLAGTPDYMSPEQGAQTAISKASDWYSVGVILYQALTGRLPFRGRFFEVMLRKQTRDPIQPREVNPNLPRDLNDLCMRLLRRDPDARPSGREIMRALGVRRSPSTLRVVSESSFLGRERQIAELRDAFRATRDGQTVVAYVHGNSGMGKSTLVRIFLDQLKAQTRNAIILQGRCYERESVPFKALDGVVDSLSKHLSSLRRAKAESLMPLNRAALARVFPVMLQVDAIFDARSAKPEPLDLFTLRRQAFGALRELLTKIARQAPLVVYIDDLQWADADSTFLIEDLLRPPDAPPLLLIACFRSEDIEEKPFLKQLLLLTGTETCRELFVGPLSGGEARELTRSLFAAANLSGEPFIESIVHEAAGNPFLIEQLTHYGMMNERAATAGVTLTTMLEERIKQLPAGARSVLNVLAVARRPVDEAVAIAAAGVPDPQQSLSPLRAAQFVRSGGTQYGIEVYHDRIGETIGLLLDDSERKQIHRRLAQAIEARGLDDPEGLYEDYLGAGEIGRAAVHAEAAARKAASALAFDRAALYFRRAIELTPDAANIVDLKIGLGDALANAGRPAEAAREFLEIANRTSARRALELRQRAGAQLLMGGHMDEGLDVFRVVLESVGLRLAKGPRRALVSLFLRRLLIRLRGLNFTERSADDIPESDLLRIDICWAVAAGLGVVDLIRGADFQSLHLLLALRAGEISRVARAMAFEVGHMAASGGGGARDRVAYLIEVTEALARRANNPHARGLAIWARGLSSYLLGQWREAAEYCERAAEILRDECTGVTWELTIANRFMLSSLLYLGEMVEVSRRVPQLLSAAVEQGNVFAATDLRTRLNTIWLAADDPTRARDEVISAMTIWPREGFHLQHYSSLVALAQIELYTGDYEIAWKHLDSQMKPLERSMLLRIQGLRIDAMQIRARLALASAVGSPRQGHLRLAEKLAGKIEREEMEYANPLATLIRAGVARQRGDDARAITLAEKAAKDFDAVHMRLYAVAARRRLGEMIGGDRGRQLVAQTEEWMSKQLIKNPARMINMIAPGF